MSNRLTHLNQLLDNLGEQLAGLEKALVKAAADEKVRLQQQIRALQNDMQPYEKEKAVLMAATTATPSPDSKPAAFTSYNVANFVGREVELANLRVAMESKRLLWIQGMTGIGKTTLAERIAVEALEQYTYVAIDCQRDFANGDFIQGAIALMGKLGNEATQQLPEEEVLPNLVQVLSRGTYWLQLDSVEALVEEERFQDNRWGTALAQVLREARDLRMVLTTQMIPQAWDTEGRYAAVVETVFLQGLTPEQSLDLFALAGVHPHSEIEKGYLEQITADFEGHPFILQITAGEIKLPPFNGNVGRYWQDYYQKERQQRPNIRRSQRHQVETRVRRVIEQLPEKAQQLLLVGSVFGRTVTEDFYRALLPEVTKEVLELLIARELLQEREWSEFGWLLGQHNLVREAAQEFLRKDPQAWKAAHRQAAEIWLKRYKPIANASNLDTVRGCLEALNHYCAVEDWNRAKNILLNQSIGLQLQTWGYYQEMLTYHRRLSGHLEVSDEVSCLKSLGNAHCLLGEYSQAIICYEKSLDLAKTIDDKQGQRKALNNLGNVFRNLGKYAESVDYLKQTLTLAQEIGDRRGEEQALGNIGNIYQNLGQHHQAIDFYQQCLDLAQEIGDRLGEGQALGSLGLAYSSLAEYQVAIDFYQQSLAIKRDIGDRQGEGTSLGNLGEAYSSLGQYQQAIVCHQQSLAIKRDIGDRLGEGNTLGNLGLVYARIGEYSQSMNFHQQALNISREIGNRLGEGNALGNLGLVYYRLKQYSQSLDFHQQALNISRELGDRQGEGISLENLGATLTKLERYPESLQSLQKALDINREIGFQAGIAETLKDLAELQQALGEVEIAQDYCQEALTLAQQLGLPLQAECKILLERLI